MNWIETLWRKLAHLVGKPRPFKTIQVEDMPGSVEREALYLIGEDEMFWFAAMQCPCGCRAKIQLSLLPDDKPKWSAEVHANNTVSLHPSVWRKVGCKSHFWFKHGRVHWC